MRAAQLVVRCYAEPEGSQWVAVCVDLSLAAQADSLEEAKEKLDAQIREYIFDALAGEDRAHAGQLLTRKAPLRFRLKYALASVRIHLSAKFGTMKPRAPVRFKKSLPLVPALC
jgi:hypothetical protein